MSDESPLRTGADRATPATAPPEEPLAGSGPGHVVLVGLPGAGKSTVGRAVSKQLARPFLDFDIEIARRTGFCVAELFATRGEAEFRKLEVDVTKELAFSSGMVLAPGGGWITNPGVVDLLRPPGRVVYLRISPAEALRRLARARVARPLLLGPDPAGSMEQLWQTRAPLYAQADFEIDVEVNDSQRVIDLIVSLAHDLTPRLG